MAQEIVFDIVVNGDGTVNTTKALKTQLREAQEEANKLSIAFGSGSKEAIEATKRVAAMREELADVKETINAFHPEAKFTAVAGAAQSIAGGFAAAEGAMALFGAESEDLQKSMLKVQSAMALSQGLNEVNGMRDSFKNLGLVIQQTSLYQKVAAGAQAAYNFVVGAGSTALTVFRGALLATGIGAVIVGIAALAANWERLNKWIRANSESIKEAAIWFLKFTNPIGLMIVGFQELAKRVQFVGNIVEFVKEKFSLLAAAIQKLLEDLNLIDTAEEDLAQAQAERTQETINNYDAIEKKRKQQIELAAAEGKSAKELRDMEISMIKDRVKAYEDLAAKKKAIGEEMSEEEKATLEDSQHELKLKLLEDARLTKEEEDKKLENIKKAQDKRLEEAKKYREKELDLERQIQDARVSLIKDDFDRELESIQLTFSRKYEAIKGNGAKEKELRELIEKQKQQATEDLIKKFDDERLQKEAEQQIKEFESQNSKLQAQLIQLELNGQATFEKQREIANQELFLKLQNKDLSDGQVELMEAEHYKRMAAIDKAENDQSVKRDQDIFNAKIQIGQNLANGLISLGQLVTNNKEKQAKFEKAAAIVQLGVDTAKAISSTIAGATAAAAAGGPAAPFLVAGYITSGIATVLSSMAQAKKALGSDAAGAGGGVSPTLATSLGGPGGAPQLGFNGSNTPVTKLPDSQQSQNIKVAVVESDITNTQGRVKALENKATF